MQKLLNNKKILFVSLLCVVLLIGIFGYSSIVAQPTLEDSIENRIYGTYTPNSFYDDNNTSVDDWKVVGSINTTDIIVENAMWIDYNGDGFTDLEDLYAQENYQFHFLMDTHTLPILSIGSDKDWYMVKLSELDQIDQVIASVHVANNNDNAEVKDLSTYFFDKTTNILYLGRELMNDLDAGCEMKIQTVAIVHDIDKFTKEFAFVTGFSEEIENNPLQNRMPDGVMRRQFKQWLMDGLEISLVQPEHLAYVSKDCFTVFVNRQETDDYVYDATTGTLSFPSSTPYNIDSVMVYFHKLNNVSTGNAMLQYAQNKLGSTAQAITFDDWPENAMCKHITYTSEPVIGKTEELDFYAFAHYDIPKDATETTVDVNKMDISGLTVFNDKGAVSREDLLRAIAQSYKGGQVSWDDNGAVTSNDTTVLANGILSVWKPSSPTDGNMAAMFSSLNAMYTGMGNIVNGERLTYLDEVSNSLTKLSVYSQDNRTGQLLSGWQYWHDNVHVEVESTNATIGLYMVGKNNSTNALLGGVVDEGFPYFSVASCNILMPNVQYNPIPNATKDDSHKTVISIVGRSDKYLYVCISPLSLSENGSRAYERLCGFTKIRYTYTGRGNVTLVKTDVNGVWVGDAIYGIYKGNLDNTGTLTNETPVHFYDYFSDLEYEDKEEAKPSASTSIKTSATAAVKVSLPYNTNGESYFFQEVTPPEGYLRDTNNHYFRLNDKRPNEEVRVIDYKQDGIIYWTVYDETTRNHTVKIPLAGIPFTMVDESGQPAVQYSTTTDQVVMTYERIVTDSSGQIKFQVRPGTYYIRQLDTLENYHMDMRKKEDTDRINENCNYYKIEITADISGKHIQQNHEHLEKRQEVQITTQIYDKTLGNKTPAILGGTDAGYVETINSQWELYVKEGTLLVGYLDDGTKVQINNATGPLNVDSDSIPGKQSNVGYKGSDDNNKTTTPALSYISATHVTIGGLRYPLPNGTYYWKLKQASSGYVSENNNTTDLDAKWLDENKRNAIKSVMDESNQDEVIFTHVTMTRQETDMTIYTKEYDKTENTHYAFNFKEVIPTYQSYDFDETANKFVTNTCTISVDSSEAKPSLTSSERFNYRNQSIYATELSTYTSTQTNGTSQLIAGLKPHSIYQLQNSCDIVTINGGVIPANTILGRYMSDNDGYIYIKGFGSEAITNPNVTSKDTNPTFAGVGVIDNAGHGANNTPLPNGHYILSTIMAPDDYEIEKYFENTPIDLKWTVADSMPVLNQNHYLLSTVNTVPLYHARNTKNEKGLENTGTYIAPSPIDTTPEDPYDPKNPDDAQNPDDSNDIPAPANTQWIIDHRNDRAYRTIDRFNVTQNNGITTYDTQDTVPTTFALAYDDSTETEWNSTYSMYMFYEITKDAYELAKQEFYNDGVRFDTNATMEQKDYAWARNWEYREQVVAGTKLYFRQFTLTGTSGAYALTQNLVFNKTTTGWDGANNLIKRNEVLSGAIFNTTWINQRMAEPGFNGNYHIAFGVLTSRETVNPLTGAMLRKEQFSDNLAILSIRNRELFNID